MREFKIFSPKVVALIGNLDDTLADRCIPVRMFRRSNTDKRCPTGRGQRKRKPLR